MRHSGTTALAAAAAITALGGLAAVPAQAAAAAPARQGLARPVYSRIFAGYRAGYRTGWRFRWATTTVRVPSCSAPSAQHGWFVNGTSLGINSPRWLAELGAGCAGQRGATVEAVLVVNGSRSVRALGLRPRAGAGLTLSIYYDQQAGQLRLRGTDRATGIQVTRWVKVGRGISYRGAGAGSVFTGRVSSPVRPVRTGTFTSTQLTSYDGHRGTLLGPWPTSAVIATATGTAAGRVIAYPSPLRDAGAAFWVWQRAGA